MQSGDLSTIFAAPADPRAIVERLSEGDAPVRNLAEPFDLSGSAITKHLKVLARAGLISRSREGQKRPCRLKPRALEPSRPPLTGSSSIARCGRNGWIALTRI
jgi:DNA-binding transcriptional ArsR family regulator